MSARTKLNAVAFAVVLLFAALVGASFHSWLVFVIVSIVSTLLMLHAGEMRLNASDKYLGRSKPKNRQRR